MSIPSLLSVVLFILRILIGAMFILAGALKVKAGSHWFLARVLAYDLIRGKVAKLLARGLPWLEMICGLFLIAGFLLPVTVGVSFALLLVFTMAVVTAFLRDKEVDCGCFGHRIDTQPHKARWTVAYRNLLLMGLLIIVYSFESGLSMDGWLNGQLYQLDTNVLGYSWLATLWLTSLFSTITLQLLARRRALALGRRSQSAQTVS